MKKRIFIILTAVMLLTSCRSVSRPGYNSSDPVTSGSTAATETPPQNTPVPLTVITIETETGQDVTSKEEYILSTFTLTAEDGRKITVQDVNIRGRGNQSWTVPKKSYRLKFPSKTALFSDPESANKHWVLIANHCDKSLMRNYIAYSLGKALDGIEWSPSVELTEVWLNGEYRGVYLLTEQVRVGSRRVNIDDSGEKDTIGFLVEMDSYAEGEEDADYIVVDGDKYTLKSDIRTKGQINYLKWYLTCCREAIRAGTREEAAQLIDLDSLADMYLLQEYMRNVDVGWSSFYLYVKEDSGKLYFGPPWDFDLAAGNSEQNSVTGLYVGNPEFAHMAQANSWYQELIRRDWFRELVAERWEHSADKLLKTVSDCMDYAERRLPYLEKNFSEWNIFSERINREPDELLALTSCEAQLDYLGSWLDGRWDHLSRYFSSEEFIRGDGLQ